MIRKINEKQERSIFDLAYSILSDIRELAIVVDENDIDRVLVDDILDVGKLWHKIATRVSKIKNASKIK